MSRTHKDMRRFHVKKYWESYYGKRRQVLKLQKIYEFNAGSLTLLKEDLQLQYLNYTESYKSKRARIKGLCFFKTTYDLVGCDYSSAPSWHTRLYMNRPERRKTHLLEQKIKKGEDNENILLFPEAKKFVYYW